MDVKSSKELYPRITNHIASFEVQTHRTEALQTGKINNPSRKKRREAREQLIATQNMKVR